MSAVVVLPFALQALAMVVDEGLFHRRRGLPRWERVGHPLDTLTIAACYAWLVAAQPAKTNLTVYGALAVLSCFFVTKDEPIHAARCSPGEQWIHAVLFVLHPVVLITAAYLWWTRRLLGLLVAELALAVTFAAYQMLYWNGPWQKRAK